MKKNKNRAVLLPILALTAISLCGAALLTSCYSSESEGQTTNLTDDPLATTTVVADWTDGEADAFFASDGWTNGSPFNAQWNEDNICYENGVMKLSITDNPNGSEETYTEYYGGEARSYQHFGYGDYEVSMKPSATTGTASTFFLYTGPSEYDDDGNPNPWDEIDIEFLGYDTTRVQFNYFVDGVGGHEYMYDLGFDASEEFHTYGFRWTESYITWFVDGEPVYRVNASSSRTLPSTESRILMNYWSGTSSASGWMGTFSGVDEDGPEYQWVKTSATATGEIPEKVEETTYEGDWDSVDSLEANFSTGINSDATDYVVTPSDDNKSANVTWTTAGNWSNVSFTVDEAASKDKNWLHLVLKNNGTEEVNTRINVRSTSSTTTNLYGYGNGETLKTNSGEGTLVDIEAGETIEIEICYSGTFANAEIMLNSMQTTDLVRDGDITISEIKFDKQGEVEESTPSVNNGVIINGETIVFNSTAYVINTDDKSNTMNVTYSNIAGNSYSNISASVSSVAYGKSEFTFTITNNGEDNVKLRVDTLLSSGDVSTTGISALGESTTSWSSSDSACVTIAGNDTETVTVTYSGTIATLNIFIDSSTWDDESTYSGDVTFSDMSFGGEATDIDEPTITDGESVALAFYSTEQYTVDKNGEEATEVNVTYENISGGTYNNISANIASFANNYDIFTITIKNNGVDSVTARVDLLGENTVGNTNVSNQNSSAVGATNSYTDTEWGGTYITIAGSQEATLTINYESNGRWGDVNTLLVYLDTATYDDANTYSGNVTLSGFTFSSAE